MKKKVEIWDAQHPKRQKAIAILEWLEPLLAEKGLLKNDHVFDGELWYELEDGITNILHQ
jgi:hypothetical protein